VLAAEGWAAVADDMSRRRHGVAVTAGIVGAAGGIVGICAMVLPDVTTRAAYALAVSTHLKTPAAAAAFLARVAPPLIVRASALLLAGGVLVAVAARHRMATALLAAALCADLLITNGGLNVTMELAKLSPPAWFTSAAGEQRLYIGGRVRGYMNGGDPDAVSTWQIPAEATAVEGRMELNALLPMAPSGWRVREALSYDLPYLWPAQYEATVRRFERGGRLERDAFLRRSGVRWCVVPMAQQREWRAVANVDDWNMRVYACHPGATRAYIAESATVAANPTDEAWAREALFDPALPDETVRLAAMPPPAGRAGGPESLSLRFVRDDPNDVALDATLTRPSVVVLRDTFDPSWTATVDGLPAAIARANGIYRAVAVPAGHHTIRFQYRPRDFLAGLTLSVAAAGLLIGSSWFRRFEGFRRFRGPGPEGSAGFPGAEG